MFIFDATTNYGELVPTIYQLLLLQEESLCIGESQAVGSLTPLGGRPLLRHSLKTQTRNFGTGIRVRNMLLSMNSEAGLMSAIYSDGSTNIQFSWKSRVALFHWLLELYGLQVTFHPSNGILTWMALPGMPSSEGSRSPNSERPESPLDQYWERENRFLRENF